MQRELPAVRILPMSHKQPGFLGRSIEDLQQNLFLRDLPKSKGRYRYRTAGMNADPGTIVLFQFRARIIAYAIFLRDEKSEDPDGGRGGAFFFDPASFRTFVPVDIEGMRKAWPRFGSFGHVKQVLNPAGFAVFKRGLKKVTASDPTDINRQVRRKPRTASK